MKGITAILILMTVLVTASCGGKKPIVDPKTMSDKEIYERGMKYKEKKDYAKARDALRAVFDNFPKSDYRILAKFEYAETYFEQGSSSNYVVAIQEYQDFISLFPFSPKACLAQTRIGVCYFKMTEKPDRDQSNTRLALDEFRKVVDNYPDCEYYQEAYDYLIKTYSLLAEHEYQVGKFYQRTGRPQAAVDRYKGILKTYPESVHQPKVYLGLGESLLELNQFAESCVFYEQLLEKWPKDETAKDAMEGRNKACKK